MAKRSETARLLEQFRSHKGLSALELSNRASLNINYVRSVERDLRSCGWEAAERISKALNLDALERLTLFEAIDRADKPESVREVLAAPVPGVVLWKYLPKLLWSVTHDQVAPHYTDLDQVVTDLVRSAASLLAWVWLRKNPPDKKQVRRLCNLAEQTRNAVIPAVSDPTERIVRRPSDEYIDAEVLPGLWRQTLFGSRRSAEAAVKLLARWGYHLRLRPGREDIGRLSFQFRDADLQEQWGVRAVPADEITSLHNGMLMSDLHGLVTEAGLDIPAPIWITYFQEQRRTTLPFIENTQVEARLNYILGLSEEQIRQDLPAKDAASPPPLTDLLPTRNKYAGDLNYARFALRIFGCGYAASVVFGKTANETRKAILAKCDLLEQSLRATDELIDLLDARRRQESEAYLADAGFAPDPPGQVPQ